jgi:hypothetical protein
MARSSGDQPAEALPADTDDEERLGTRRSFWGRMRHRFGGSGLPTKDANEAIGLQGDDPSRVLGPLGPFGPFGH